jgi:hypothetical protein
VGAACGDPTDGPCTHPDSCDAAGACRANHESLGAACGDTTDDACTQPDLCDAAGLCLSQHATDGTVCPEGVCTAGACGCFSDTASVLPYIQQWQMGQGDADFSTLSCELGCTNVPDHVVVFTAPSSSTFRFSARSAGGDPVLAVFAGSCVLGSELSCNLAASGTLAELALPLAQGEVVTVVVSEQCETDGGDGNLFIEVAPD